MMWVPTIKQMRAKSGQKRNIVLEKMDAFVSKLYWMYYVHLPFYVMTSDDAFYLHVFFLSIFSLSLFGVIKYCFL
ncbi:Tsc3p KNAG_0J00810 [Huiozyma naganishii CBS 8797]|uniref:Uncharacterized protein n=1 Tax=Huiozyma naganishii (strain ATCC MYA-139 / BCRC 22969 / CBS 8797 / KCTC 17520 / NBRC 10181 / NCYC 3082 / Yp74L-3) TaxID=1071383 RepID=J7RQS2_HUIN7|nr:hypothetical protein KNAG_0J00810 [Kazachstania naganishii CBS 8797]CCK72163.1 hypothetical protein KNAG_0J00810 [Kazachstania naganishii CBS 8797]